MTRVLGGGCGGCCGGTGCGGCGMQGKLSPYVPRNEAYEAFFPTSAPKLAAQEQSIPVTHLNEGVIGIALNGVFYIYYR